MRFRRRRRRAPSRGSASIPITFLVANIVEWAGHRHPMHRPMPPLRILYDRHTREHHHYFTDEAMAFESSRDFKMVLFPPAMLLFFLGGIAAPIGTALRLAGLGNVAWLFVATAVAYFLTYEALHFAYHVSGEGWLARHHRLHHDKALMGKHNFNVSFPIADLLFGTYVRTRESELDLRAELDDTVGRQAEVGRRGTRVT